MILVNQTMKTNKGKEIDANLELQTPRGGYKKSTKFNIGGFLKKIPLPVNKRAVIETKDGLKEDTTDDTKDDANDEADKFDLSLSLAAKNSATQMPISSGQGRVILQDNGSYTHEMIPVGSSSDQLRYAMFTSKCISLENSEATSQLDLDEHSEDELLYFPGTRDISGWSSTLKSPQKMNEANNTVTSIVHNPDARGEIYQNYNHITKFEAYRQEVEEDEDVVEYLSETESDLNVNPHQEENINDYKTGGYHPVSKGEVYYSRDYPKREYVILRKLGWGHFSTVWLAKSRYNVDLNPTIEVENPDTDDHYVAIKFVKSSDNYVEAAEDEIKLLKTLDKPLLHSNHLKEANKNFFKNYEINDLNQPVGHPGYKHVMRLLDDFQVVGPNGKHICMVFEILGENILNLIYKSKTISKELKQNTKESNEKKDVKIETNRNFKSFKSKLSLGLINPPRRDNSEVDVIEGQAYVKNSSPDSLTRLIETQKTYGGIPLTLVKQIVKQIFLAVDYMHHCGIIHTDIKPENILIEINDVDNVIKILENERIIKFNSKYKNRKDSSISTISMNDMKGIRRNNSANIKTRQNSVGYGSYRKSRNSICGKCDSPVRTSKPLSSSFRSDSLFKEMSFSNNGNHNTRNKSVPKIIDVGVSPTNMSVIKLNTLENDKPGNNLISIKIADLGNATFSHYHFTNQIQTRQYRAPEILLKHKTWGASTDIWSIGCVIFELITGDYLFDPHNGNNFNKDEDHMAQIIELLCEFPSSDYLKNCELASSFFNKDSEDNYSLKNINNLKYWPLHDVLVQKYKFDENDINVKLICDLILKCLIYDLGDRYDCKSLVNHPWLNDEIDFDQFDLQSLKNLPKNHSDIPGFTS